MHTKLEVDVYGHWSDNPPIYRIYVDNEMLVERTFGWPSYQNYITEHMYCDLDTGVHTLILENLDPNSRFELGYFAVNKQPVNKNLLKTNDNKIEWRFIIDNLLNDPQYNKLLQTLSQSKQHNLTVNLAQVSKPTPLAPIPERPKKVVRVKNYETYIPLVQRTRQLNTKK
jgi:hypothetical protein